VPCPAHNNRFNPTFSPLLRRSEKRRLNKRYDLDETMRQISDNTKELIQGLYQPKATFDFFWKKNKKICELLEKIKTCCEPAVIPDILYLIFSKDADVSNTAIMAIDSLLNNLSTKDLIWFDQYFRQRTSGWSHYGSEWNKLNPSKIKLIPKFPGFQLSLLALLSFHSNGFVREEALKRLNLLDNGGETPFILLRLNDWVDQVREQATKAIEKRITKRYAPHLLSNIFLVSALANSGRYDHSSFIESVHELMRKDELKDAVKKILHSDDIYIRRECYDIVLKTDIYYLTEVIQEGIFDSDVVVRNRIIKSLKRIPDYTLVEQYLEKLEQDPFMPNRREILNIDIELFPKISDEKLIKALFDPHPSIRYDARYYLSKKAVIDFADKYRDAVNNPNGKNLIGIIGGLGETGESNDAKFIANYLQHRIAKIRKSSIKAIAKLSADKYRKSFLALIKDDSPRVSKEAALALLQCGHQSIVRELWEIYETSDKIHIAKNIFLIVTKLSKWEAIVYIIEAFASKHETIRDIANDYLNKWLWNFNRSFTKPSNEQKERIASLMQVHRNKIGDKRLKTIEFNMKTF
jgi:HEAT repeat protein